MIKVYTKEGCVQCKMLKKYLKEHGFDFTTLNVTYDTNALNYLKSQGIGSLPVVELNNKIEFTGFRPDLVQKLPK